MATILNRPFSYLLFLTISSYLFLLTTADNVTDHHSNETIVEYNSTLISLTTIANVSNEDVVVDEENKNVSSSEMFNDSTVVSTSVPMETTEVSLSEVNTTVNEKTDLTTSEVSLSESNTTVNEDMDLATNVTEVYTENNEEQTIVVSNTSCELSTYGCCSDGVTEQNGKNF
jgi:hypothetical protein